MIKHIMKTLWNRKREYYGIFTEQVLVTIILMLSVVAVTKAIKTYTTPGLLNVDDVVLITYHPNSGNIPSEVWENTTKGFGALIENMRKLPYVKAISATFNIAPYTKSESLYLEYSDSIHIDGNHFKTMLVITDEHAAAVLNPKMEEGAWHENRQLSDEHHSVPTVITRQFADAAGWTSALGKKFTINGIPFTVVGVMAGLKSQPFTPSPIAMTLPTMFNTWRAKDVIVKLKKGMEKEFVREYDREFTRRISDKRMSPAMLSLGKEKGNSMSGVLQNIVMQGIPTLFLFIFGFIGTFGLYWMISRRRIKEYALRIALGSTKGKLIGIVIGESLILTGLAVLPALILSFFLYTYDTVHIIAVGSTILTMLIFAIISAWYPAWMVSKVNPSESLKYE